MLSCIEVSQADLRIGEALSPLTATDLPFGTTTTRRNHPEMWLISFPWRCMNWATHSVLAAPMNGMSYAVGQTLSGQTGSLHIAVLPFRCRETSHIGRITRPASYTARQRRKRPQWTQIF